MKSLTFITTNKNKLKEARGIFGKSVKLTNKKIELEEIQSVESKQVIEREAKQAYEILNCPVIVEDTSLYIKAWNGLPGALIRWFVDRLGCDGICKLLAGEKNREAVAEVAIAYKDKEILKTFFGQIQGIITTEPKGDKGFGWDPIFMPKGYNKTFGEMTQEEKNKISMRKIAFEKLKKYLLNN